MLADYIAILIFHVPIDKPKLPSAPTLSVPNEPHSGVIAFFALPLAV